MTSNIIIDNIRLPPDIERGASGGPLFRTSVFEGDAGRVVTNQNWQNARGEWRVTYGYLKEPELAVVISFFRARGAQARGFLFKDWSDFIAGDGVAITQFGTGTGAVTDFPLYKIYPDSVNPTSRRIFRPISSTMLGNIYVNGVMTATWSLITPGIVRFASAPAAAAVIGYKYYEFDVPVMFGQDQLSLNVAWKGATAVNELVIRELRE